MNDNGKKQLLMEYWNNGVKAVIWENETRNGSMFNTTLVHLRPRRPARRGEAAGPGPHLHPPSGAEPSRRR